MIVGLILGWVEDNPFIEISLTTVLAYLAFILAEEGLAVSGVMAALAAGLVIGGWGKTKVSPSVAKQFENQWGYLAAVSNSLVFLMVGLRVDLRALAAVLPLLAIAVAAMLLSRGVSVFGLIPVVGRLPGTEPVGLRYQAVIFWGGMRGGIALAIALALPPIPGKDTIVVPLVMGAVLFTLLVQGLTVERLVRWLGLHVPSLSDRVARIEGLLAAKERTLAQIPDLQAGGLFSPRIAESVRGRCTRELERMHADLSALREHELNLDRERPLLHLRCFGEEKTLYYQMFSRGHLSERAYRDLTHSIELQTEAIRHDGRLPEYTLHPPTGERLETVLHRMIAGVPGLAGLAERLRAARTARDYEIAWARSRGSQRVLEDLEELAVRDASRIQMVEELRALYQYWREGARARLDQTAEQFPEFVAATQERLADRLVLHAEQEVIEEKAHSGIIPQGVAEAMLGELAHELRELKASQPSHLRVEPEELLRKVPFFEGLPTAEFLAVAGRLRRRTAPAGEIIVRQGGTGRSLFLVARGVVRVSRQDGGSTRDLATQLDLRPGDAHALPFGDAEFDALLCECALSTFLDQAGALAEMRRVLRPGGRIAVSDMIIEGEVPAGLAEWVHTGTCLGRALSVVGYQRALTDVGFRVTARRAVPGALHELLRRIKRNLVGAALAAASGNLGVNARIDVREGRTVLRAAEDALAAGVVSYGVFVAERPA